MAQIDEIYSARLQKLDEIKKLGWNPYVSKFDKEHTIAQCIESEGKMVKTAGKVTSLRTHGNICFADLKDSTGKIQLFFKKDLLKDEHFKNLKYIDIGDFLGVEGEVMTTTAGEISIAPTNYQLLTKSLLPLPHEWYGLKDVETRYRKRYLDLIMNEEERHIFNLRGKVITLLRSFLDEHDFIEVETPILQPLYGGAYAKPFVTHHNALDADFYLRIAVELYLKRLVVGGYERVYEIGKNFRNEGFSRAHNPEFTMLEFYWAYADYEKLMEFTEEMLTFVIREVKRSLKVVFEDQEYDFITPWQRKTYRELFSEYLKFDINEVTTEEALQKIVDDRKLLDVKVVGYGQMLDELYKKYVRPNLRGPMFVTEYPLEIKALAKVSEKDPTKSASFQLVINGVEMINAYNELNDPLDQKARWEEEMKLAERGGEDYQVLDEDYIEALSYGMPPTAGWGMGVDRFVAFLTNKHAIKDVILFPTMRPEKNIDPQKLEKKPEPKKITSHGKVTKLTITREHALRILKDHLKNKNLISHCMAVEASMGALARKFGGDEVKWKMTGLLHDADWEETQSDPTQHTLKTIEWIKATGENDGELIESILTHNFKNNGFRKAESLMEWSLYTCDELTGFIVAVALVRPEKKLEGVTTESVIKKFPMTSFARPVDREQIKLCTEMLGIPLEEFVEVVLKAMQEIADEIGL